MQRVHFGKVWPAEGGDVTRSWRRAFVAVFGSAVAAPFRSALPLRAALGRAGLFPQVAALPRNG